jgi:hypothetical protein
MEINLLTGEIERISTKLVQSKPIELTNSPELFSAIRLNETGNYKEPESINTGD